MGSPKESLEKKNIFVEKYDEIRRLDGNNWTIKYYEILNFLWIFDTFGIRIQTSIYLLVRPPDLDPQDPDPQHWLEWYTYFA